MRLDSREGLVSKHMYKVLVIEDREALRIALRRSLLRHVCDALPLTEAVGTDLRQYDLILVSPDLAQEETFRRIAIEPCGPKVYVLLRGGEDDSGQAFDAARSGASGYLRAPLTDRSIENTLRRPVMAPRGAALPY